MKPKKAVTLLTRIETLLSDVLDEYSVIEKHVEKNVRAVLLSAQESVVSAINFISALPSYEPRPKASKGRKAGRRPVAAKRKAKPSVRAKKRVTGLAAKKRP
jgi:division protein CdvB (Snf7/Vps24/ESCRT-III family)